MVNHLKEYASFEKISIIDNENKKLDLDYDVIYLLGGNHETQLEFLKNNHYDDILRKYDGILLCTSCGAMNIAKNGYYSKEEPNEYSYFYDGIDLVDITIDPHFNIENKEQVEEAKRMSLEHMIYGVPNSSCIKFENNNLTLIGNIYKFKNGIMENIS